MRPNSLSGDIRDGSSLSHAFIRSNCEIDGADRGGYYWSLHSVGSIVLRFIASRMLES